MARNLAHGKGLICLGSPCLKYPPGYAAIVSPLFLIRDRPFLELSILHWLLSVAFMLGVYVWARRVAPGRGMDRRAERGQQHLLDLPPQAGQRAGVRHRAGLGGQQRGLGDVGPQGPSLAAGGAAALLLLALLCLIRPVGIATAGGCGAAMLVAAWRGMVSWRRAVAMSLLAAAVAVLAVAVVMVREQDRLTARGSTAISTCWPATQSGRWLRGPWLTISEIGRVTIPGMLKCYGRQKQWLDINMLVYVPFFVLLAVGWVRWVRRQADPFAWTLLVLRQDPDDLCLGRGRAVLDSDDPRAGDSAPGSRPSVGGPPAAAAAGGLGGPRGCRPIYWFAIDLPATCQPTVNGRQSTPWPGDNPRRRRPDCRQRIRERPARSCWP